MEAIERFMTRAEVCLGILLGVCLAMFTLLLYVGLTALEVPLGLRAGIVFLGALIVVWVFVGVVRAARRTPDRSGS